MSVIRTDLNIKLQDQFKMQLQELIAKSHKQGLIISDDLETADKYLYQYDVATSSFIKKDYINEFAYQIKTNIENPFNIDIDVLEVTCLILDEIPYIKLDDLTNFEIYQKAKADLNDNEDFQTGLRDLLAMQKHLCKNIEKKNPLSLLEQAKVLNKKNVFYIPTSSSYYNKGKYYQYVKSDDEFKEVNYKDIKDILVSYFKIENSIINDSEIQKNMRSDIYINTVCNSQFPIEYNKNKKLLVKMNSNKKSFNLVNGIVKNFYE